jgi:competence protein ComEC
MVLYNPLYILFDAGFQLSFLATIAVIIGGRWFERFVRGVGWKQGFLEIAWLALWVQFFLFPILLFQFHFIPYLAVPANILFLPFVPVAMFGAFSVGLLTTLFPAGTLLFGWFGYLPLTFIIRGVEWLNTSPVVQSGDIQIPFWMVCLWYIIFAFFLIWWERRIQKKRYGQIFTCQHLH